MQCVMCGRDTHVVSTRVALEGATLARRRECTFCLHRFNTFEIDDGLQKTVVKTMARHFEAVRKRQALTLRNEKILVQLRAGEKHAVVAHEFGLSDNTISTIARNAGVPAYQRVHGARAPAKKETP